MSLQIWINWVSANKTAFASKGLNLILALKHFLARPALAEEAEFIRLMEAGKGGTGFVIDAALPALQIF